MNEQDLIILPDEIKPADGRFGSGPSKVPVEHLQSLANTGDSLMGTSHRRPTVKGMVARIRSGLRDLFELPSDYEVVIGNGGATLFWDAAVFSLIDRRSEHLVFGEFSAKFAKAASACPHLSGIREIRSDYGDCPDPIADENVDVYALTHNETSTGVMAPISRPSENGLVLVDATSAAGTVQVDASVYDAYYFSPQKAFAADGGIYVAFLSPAAIERIAKLTSSRYVPAMLDLQIAVDNSRADQTYNTPALATLYLMERQIEWLLSSGGLAFSEKRTRDSANAIYGWAERSEYAQPFVTRPELRSNATATIDFSDQIDAQLVAKTLRANGIVDVEPYRKLGRNQLRVALFPAIDPSDIEALTACIDYIVERISA